jgi:hypothetical protein
MQLSLHLSIHPSVSNGTTVCLDTCLSIYRDIWRLCPSVRPSRSPGPLCFTAKSGNLPNRPNRKAIGQDFRSIWLPAASHGPTGNGLATSSENEGEQTRQRKAKWAGSGKDRTCEVCRRGADGTSTFRVLGGDFSDMTATVWDLRSSRRWLWRMSSSEI